MSKPPCKLECSALSFIFLSSSNSETKLWFYLTCEPYFVLRWWSGCGGGGLLLFRLLIREMSINTCSASSWWTKRPITGKWRLLDMVSQGHGRGQWVDTQPRRKSLSLLHGRVLFQGARAAFDFSKPPLESATSCWKKPKLVIPIITN